VSAARADTLPPGKKSIPRRVEIRDIERSGDELLVLQPCYPALGGEFAQDYCVIRSSGPFRLLGHPYFVTKKSVHLEPVKDNHGSPERPAAVRITELARYGLETDAFFHKSVSVRSAAELRVTDSLVISMYSDIQRVTDVWRVSLSPQGRAQLTAEKLVFECRTGERFERAGPRDPLLEPMELPECPRDRPRPAPSASAPVPAPASSSPVTASDQNAPASSHTQFAVAIGLGFVLIGAVAALASKKN